MTTHDQHFMGSRYRIVEKIGEGGMGGVYRAVDRLTGQSVALKRVNAPSDKLNIGSQIITADGSIDFRLALAQEFKVLASLRHPNIISVLDYGFDAGIHPYFTMDLLENAQPILDAARNKTLEVQVDLFVQMLQALAYLHRRGIIHRDLKPANVLVTNGQVKVLDFGLATRHDDSEATVGTLAYMSPEVLGGEPAQEASDLYAIGVMAYELFAGHHPFEAPDMSQMIVNIFNMPPDLMQLDVDPHMGAIVGQLLSKNPAERYADAHDLIEALADMTGQQVQIETTLIRESFLQAANFVGRDTEMNRLSDALTATLEGRGSAWLVGGESGVGKSRLLDELRTLALVKGALVLRGQGIAEGGAPYLLWRDVIRYLCLHTELSDFEASVLKIWVADIAKLLGRPVANALPLDPQAAQKRLFGVIEDLLRRQEQPIVIILEDLHWANESLMLLSRLNRIVSSLPILIVGSYRDDERPNLAAELSDMRLLKLERLTEEAIADLSASMLGDEVGRQQAVVDLLQRETEGNVFFIVEVVRALAEEAGQLDRIGAVTLPGKVFADGIKTVVQRRLNRLPVSARSLLQIAAVAGRQLDLGMLRAVSPDTHLNNWLSACLNATVLEVEDDRYRFAHDKLREGVLVGLETEQLQALHQQVANALEAVYADELDSYYALLAYHYEQAGAPAKAIDYLELAGEQALRDYANPEAVRFFAEAARLDGQMQQDGNANEAVDNLRRALWARQSGEAEYNMSNMPKSSQYFEQALALLESGSYGRNQDSYDKEAAYAHQRLVGIYLHNGEWEHAEHAMERSTQIYERLDDQMHLVEAVVGRSWIHLFQAQFMLALRGFAESAEAGRRNAQLAFTAAGLTGLAVTALRLGHAGSDQEALAQVQAALDMLSESSEPTFRIMAFGVAAVAWLRRGYWQLAQEAAEKGLGLMIEYPQAGHFALEGFTGVAEVFLTLWEMNPDSTSEFYAKAAQQSCKSMHKFAQIVAIARPRAWIYQGWYYWLNNKADKAVKAEESAIADAQQLKMPYDEAMARYHMGRFMNKSDAKRREHLTQAEAIFDALNAFGDVSRVQQLQAESGV
jgi:tetratricopeptide (TPR) repeat protein